MCRRLCRKLREATDQVSRLPAQAQALLSQVLLTGEQMEYVLDAFPESFFTTENVRNVYNSDIIIPVPSMAAAL